GERVGYPLGHPATEVGQVVAGKAAVEDALGIVDLTVAQQVDHRLHADSPPASAAARAAAGSAAAIWSRAAESCAVETNHASYALGGRQTPRSSMAWKKAAYAAVFWVRAVA